jgi:DNA topoisomerase-1
MRDSKRGLWFSCSRFPKCRGIRSWKELDATAQAQWSLAFEQHQKQFPSVEIKMLDGTPLDYSIKIDDLIEAHADSLANVGTAQTEDS